MCLTIENNSMTPMTADKPIKVKKLLYWKEHPHYKDILTPYMLEKVVFTDGRCEMGDGRMVLSDSIGSVFELIEGELMPRDTRYPTPFLCEVISPGVYEGIHAYQWDCESIEPITPFLNKEVCILVEAIIPQGAYYYLGTKGDIVADRMTVTDVDTGPIPWETPKEEIHPVPWKEPWEIERPSNDDEG